MGFGAEVKGKEDEQTGRVLKRDPARRICSSSA